MVSIGHTGYASDVTFYTDDGSLRVNKQNQLPVKENAAPNIQPYRHNPLFGGMVASDRRMYLLVYFF